MRDQSLAICAPLAVEDLMVQPMTDASPPKWHLAHVTWFFETFILRRYAGDYQPFNPAFESLFNSYYNGIGEQFPRPRRGTLSRPTIDEIYAYRAYVDEAIARLLRQGCDDELGFLIALGLNHEQQHQELMFTDLKYTLGTNPLEPIYEYRDPGDPITAMPMGFDEHSAGIYPIGVTENRSGSGSFAFDNESPRHEVLLRAYALGNRLVTNGEFLAFIRDGGYERPDLWLSDGWTAMNSGGWKHPLYWRGADDNYFEYSLTGLHQLDLAAPVCHVSGYEAFAFARWFGGRLPTEAEWEVAAAAHKPEGNFVETRQLHPRPATDRQYFGDTWEWTQSSYGPYPGFSEFSGDIGEYNGKFMANQLVLRGGSCVTAQSHIRATYRNFFYPADRWQFSGIRLAKDL